jgi:hypothetical protein
VHTRSAYDSLEFEWDSRKRASNLEKHGLDLIDGALAFDGRTIVTVTSPREGEPRFLSLFELEGRVLALVWTRRSDAIRLISLRAARKAEKHGYRQKIGR